LTRPFFFVSADEVAVGGDTSAATPDDTAGPARVPMFLFKALFFLSMSTPETPPDCPDKEEPVARAPPLEDPGVCFPTSDAVSIFERAMLLGIFHEHARRLLSKKLPQIALNLGIA